jgi:hypothetical protein
MTTNYRSLKSLETTKFVHPTLINMDIAAHEPHIMDLSSPTGAQNINNFYFGRYDLLKNNNEYIPYRPYQHNNHYGQSDQRYSSLYDYR